MDIGEGRPELHGDVLGEKLWSYKTGDIITDRVPESKLKELIASGQLSDDTPVLAPGNSLWESVGTVKLLLQGYELKPHPWYRFFARLFDIMIFILIMSFFLGILVGIASIFIPSLESLFTSTITLCLLQMVFVCLWIIPETFLMAIFGTTLSKWIFNIKVRNSSGKVLSFGESFSRSLGATVKGFALGIPLILWVTLLLSYDKLEKTGQTSWDRDGDFKVYHGRIGVIRAIVILALVGIYLLLRILALF